jgi:excisionase family DNA binding protein
MHATGNHRTEPSPEREPLDLRPIRQTYNVAEVADLLGVSRSSLYASIRRGELRGLQFGRRVVIPVSVVEKMLASDEQSNASGA